MSDSGREWPSEVSRPVPPCTKAPAGWRCTRGEGHRGQGGPCAAVQTFLPVSFVPPDDCSDCGPKGKNLPVGHRCQCCGYVKVHGEPSEGDLFYDGSTFIFQKTESGPRMFAEIRGYGSISQEMDANALKICALWNEDRGLEMELRKIMWLSHGHFGLYGDDGEMQCSECGTKFKCWDYKNAPLDEVREAYQAACMERMQKAMAAQEAHEQQLKGTRG